MVLIDVIKIQNLPFQLHLLFILVMGNIPLCFYSFYIYFSHPKTKKQLLLSIISGTILIFRFAMFHKPPTTAQDKLHYSSQLLDPHFHTTKLSTRSHLSGIYQTHPSLFFLFEFYNINMTCIIISPFQRENRS